MIVEVELSDLSTDNYIELEKIRKEINKRTVENLIKSGALDCFHVTRKQQMIVYDSVIDSIQKERKNEIAGQMSLMDLLGEDVYKRQVQGL